MFGCPVYGGTRKRGEAVRGRVHSKPDALATQGLVWRYAARGNVDRTAAHEPGHDRGIRIVAIGDVHMRVDTPPALRDALRAVARGADLVLLTGDMTDNGRLPEVEAVAALTAGLDVPTVMSHVLKRATESRHK